MTEMTPMTIINKNPNDVVSYYLFIFLTISEGVVCVISVIH